MFTIGNHYPAEARGFILAQFPCTTERDPDNNATWGSGRRSGRRSEWVGWGGGMEDG